MGWVMELGVVTAVAGALLALSFLARRQWVLRWEGYTASVRSSPLRAVLRIDGEVVARAWRRPWAEVDIRAMVDDGQHGLITFRALLSPGLLRPRCQIYINGDWMGGDLLPGTRYDPVDWRLERGEPPRDAGWRELRELLLSLRGEASPRLAAAIDGLGALASTRSRELASLRRGDASAPVRARIRVLRHELASLRAAARDLERAGDGEGALTEALVAAERLVAHLSSARQAPQTFQLKPIRQADHSGSARIARRRARRDQSGSTS